MSHLQVRCEEGVVSDHQRDSQSHGRPGFPVAGLLLSPSGQEVSLLEEPQEFWDPEVHLVCWSVEGVCYCCCSLFSTGSTLGMLLFIGCICL